MKKFAILTLILLCALAVFAQTNNPRTLNVRIVNNDLTPILAAEHPNMSFVATMAGDAFTLTNLSTGCGFIFIGGNTYAQVQLGNFQDQWVMGDVVTVTVTRVAPGVPGEAFQVVTVPDAAVTPIWWGRPGAYPGAPIVLPAGAADTWTYNLTVSAQDHLGAPLMVGVTGPGTYAGTTPQVFTCLTEINDLLGNWTAAGVDWVVNPITVVPGDFVGGKVDHVYNGAITFVKQPPVLDTYTLNVTTDQVNPYDLQKGGVTIGQTPYMEMSNDVADLIGTYSMVPVPGYHWDPLMQEVVAGDFVAGGKSGVTVWATRADGSKVAYNAFVNFNLLEDPPIGVIVEEDGTIVTPPGTTVVPGSDPIWDGPDTGNPYQSMTITGSDPAMTVTIHRPIGWPVYWYIRLRVNGVWLVNPLNPLSPNYWEGTDNPWVTIVDLSGKGEVQILWNDNETLPVELSSFTTTLTAEYFVKLTWITQSESNLNGYRVLRSENTEIGEASSITPILIGATNTSTTHTYNLVDREVENEVTYYYWLEAVELDGSSNFHGPYPIYVEQPETNVPAMQSGLIKAGPNPFSVGQNFNIEYTVKQGETGTITVYNILGQAVKTQQITATDKEGATFTWNGKDSRGNTCASGIYFYRLSTPSMNQTKKMVLK